MPRVTRALLGLLTVLFLSFSTLTPASASTISTGYPVSLLARHADNTLYSYGGGTSGYLAPGRQVGHGWGGFNYGIQIESLIGGRYDDVIVRATDGTLRIYHSDGARLSGGYQIGSGWGGMTAIIPSDDWDGDGRPDILARTSDGRMLLYPTKGPGKWGNIRQIGHGWNGIHMMSSPGDINGDGHDDLVAVQKSTGKLLLYPGNGRGGFSSSRVIGHGWNNFVNLTSFGDMDGDGIPDMIGQRADGKLYRYSGRGNGWWKPAVQIGHGWANMTLPGPWKATTTAGPPAPAPKPPQLRQPFVYGTLRTGDRGYHMISGRVLSERRATVPGYQLWVTHNGTWPWAVKAPSTYPLVGQIMEFPESTLATNIARLDVYEGYYPGRDINTMRYHRVATTTSAGAPVWIYETTPRQAQWVVQNGYRVTNGDWFNQVRAYSSRSMARSAPQPYSLAPQGSAISADEVISIDEAIASSTCTSDLGTLTDGDFLKLQITVDAPVGTTNGYVAVPAESFVAVDSLGRPIAPFDEDAKFCSATSDQLFAFVDDGTTATGTLTFSGDIAELYWIGDDGLPQLVWSKDGEPTEPATQEPSVPAPTTEPAPSEDPAQAPSTPNEVTPAPADEPSAPSTDPGVAPGGEPALVPEPRIPEPSKAPTS